MNIIGLLILFILFIFVYMIIAEVFIMLFRITGMTDERARFQVISMLTNSGYTTKEAERITNSRTRRKLARFVMMFGYAFTVTIVSTIVNIFLQFQDTFVGGILAFIPLILIILAVIYIVKNNKFTNRIMDKLIQKIANRIMYHENSNPIIIIADYKDLIMARIELKIMPEELNGKKLMDTILKKEHGINILLKKTGETQYLPDGNTTFNLGDEIIVLGTEQKIKKIFSIREQKPDEK